MMKTITFLATCLLSVCATAQTVNWYDTPDGTVPAWGDWAFKDIYIPAGQQVDSVFGAFERPGYPADEHDYIFSFNTGPVYDNTTATGPWSYGTENSSLYGYWIDLTSFNYEGEGMVRIGLPTPAGAVWDSVGIATSSVSGVGIGELEVLKVSVFPNPATHIITIQSMSFESFVITDLIGNVVMTAKKEQEIKTLDVADLPSATYLIRQENSIVKFIKN